jgi:PcfJ-like protein
MPANLIDTKPIEQYLERLLPTQPEAARLLKLALARPLAQRDQNLETLSELPQDAPGWLRTKWPKGGPYHRFKPDADLDQQARHVADWISVAVSEREPWLDRVDAGNRDKRPFRFNNIQTLEDAYREADKDMRERNRKLAEDLAPDGEGERTVMALEGGFRIVQLLTPTALDREGVKMGHCIGQGGYDKGLLDGSRRFFSVRDAKGEPHATLEVVAASNDLVQCQGKENKPPTARYLPQVAAFVERERFHLKVPTSRSGLIEDEGRYYNIYKLPENLTITGNLDLSDTPITSLPQGLKVSGDLDLRNTPLTSLPAGLEVGGSLFICNTPITSLPAGLDVGGDLFICNTPITSLPEGLKVSGSLYLSNTPITSLPEGLKVGGYLGLSNTPITSLPEGLKVRGDLDLSNTPITSLPAGLEVSGDLYLEGSNVSVIPPAVKIGGRTIGLSGGMAEKFGSRQSNDIRNR